MQNLMTALQSLENNARHLRLILGCADDQTTVGTALTEIATAADTTEVPYRLRQLPGIGALAIADRTTIIATLFTQLDTDFTTIDGELGGE